MAKESPKKSEAKGKKSKVADLPARGLKAGGAPKVQGGVQTMRAEHSKGGVV